MDEQQLIVALVFIFLGGTYAIFPKKYFEFRAFLYKKIYKAKIEGSERVYLAYRLIGILFIIVGLFMIFLMLQSNKVVINNFKDCARAGNPVMESYPRQCRYGGNTYTEVIEDGVACTMDVKECPDGSYVGRVGPDCEFEACPGE